MKDLNSTPLWTALITPFKDNGEVDYDTLKRLVTEQDKAGNGILVLGSTGESLNIDNEERQEIFKFVTDLNPEVPLMAGIGGINLKTTMKDLLFLESLNYDAYLMVTPLYAKPGSIGQTNWFKTLMDHSTRPCMLYNVPGRSGVSLSLKTVESLKDHKNLWSIKEASGNPLEFQKYSSISPSISVFSGDDAMLPEYVPHNCKGLVSVAANCWPKETHLYTKLSLSNELGEDHQWTKWSNDLFLASNPIPVKQLMAHNNTISTGICREPLTHLDMENIDQLIESDKEVKNWFNTQKL
ncbi:MAG: 4-hydroxy-tetrahydrodipicolinate synthase [Halobacteriovoraceae bacterium]|nr:4-hydroxy-tetrahydrodipicolinate synthase [Halobacteriovoraceae bacterium]